MTPGSCYRWLGEAVWSRTPGAARRLRVCYLDAEARLPQLGTAPLLFCGVPRAPQSPSKQSLAAWARAVPTATRAFRAQSSVVSELRAVSRPDERVRRSGQNMFAEIAHFTSLVCTDPVSPASPDYTLSDPSGNIFCAPFARAAKDNEWPGYDRLTEKGESTITYDPFGDGADANMWATSFTTDSSNPIQKQAGF